MISMLLNFKEIHFWNYKPWDIVNVKKDVVSSAIGLHPLNPADESMQSIFCCSVSTVAMYGKH